MDPLDALAQKYGLNAAPQMQPQQLDTTPLDALEAKYKPQPYSADTEFNQNVDIMRQQGKLPPVPATQQAPPPPQTTRATILPLEKDNSTGKVSLAVPGAVVGAVDAVKDAYKLTGEAMRGEVNPSSEQSVGRVLNAASVMTPMNPATRGMFAARQVAKPAISPAMKKAESSLNYMKANQAGLEFAPGSFNELVGGLTYKTTKEGINPTMHPSSYRAMEEFAKAVDKPRADPMQAVTGVATRTPAPVSLPELDRMRQFAGEAARSPDSRDRRMGAIIRDRVDDYLDNLKPSDISAGNPKEAIAALQAARKGWADMRRSETVDELLTVAGIKADGRLFSITGKEDAVRQQFNGLAVKIAKDRREAARWTPEQQKIIKQLGSRGSAVNIAEWIGRLSPTSWTKLFAYSGAGAGAAAAGMTVAPWAVGAAAGVGLGSRYLNRALAGRKISRLTNSLDGGQNVTNSLSRMNPGNALARGAIMTPWLPDEEQDPYRQ